MQEGPVLKNRVKELRARLDLRQSDLAKEIGVTRQTVLAIEKGRLNPSVHIALRAARVLREPVDYVFFLDYAQEKQESLGIAAKNGADADIWTLSPPRAVTAKNA